MNEQPQKISDDGVMVGNVGLAFDYEMDKLDFEQNKFTVEERILLFFNYLFNFPAFYKALG